MKLVKAIWILMTALLLASCGGGGGAGESPFNPGDGTTEVADLIVTASRTQISNTGADSVTITVTAIDAQRNALATVPVKVAADSDAIVTTTASDTDETGALVATLTIGANRSDRVITVGATSGDVSRSITVQVTGTDIDMVLNPAIVRPSTRANVQIRVIDDAGNAMVSQAVTVTAAGLNPAEVTGTTDSNGAYVYEYTSPATSGDYEITVTSAGKTVNQTLQVQAAGSRPVVTETIVSASVAADPSVVAVNLPDSSVNRSEIRALFVGADNKPIPNVRVYFDLDGDANNVGGTFTAGTDPDQPLYTNEAGVVSTAYVPGTRSSPTDGVTVRACYGVSNTDPNLINCTTNATKTITVTSEALNVSIGTNATIIVDELTYTKRLNVSVVDSSGAAKAGVNLVASVDLPIYRKGFYLVGLDGWGKAGGLPTGDTAICANEDTNRNAVLEGSEGNDRDGLLEAGEGGEDQNDNGALEPRKADVRIRLLSNKTDANGSAVLEVTYDQDHASWVDALITVSASGIAGTEGRAVFYLAPVPVDIAQIRNTSAEPAFEISPYGVSGSCTNAN